MLHNKSGVRIKKIPFVTRVAHSCARVRSRNFTNIRIFLCGFNIMFSRVEKNFAQRSNRRTISKITGGGHLGQDIGSFKGGASTELHPPPFKGEWTPQLGGFRRLRHCTLTRWVQCPCSLLFKLVKVNPYLQPDWTILQLHKIKWHVKDANISFHQKIIWKEYARVTRVFSVWK